MARINSWESLPFVDLIVVDANENYQCPESHPDEFIFEVWPGITAKCDCLQREDERTYTLNHGCVRDEGNRHSGNSYRRRLDLPKYHDTWDNQ